MPLLKRASKRQGTRLYVVSDFHASDPAWRKLLNAIRLNVYKADAVLYASSSSAQCFVDQGASLTIGEGGKKPLNGSIGPQTSETMRKVGLSVDFEAATPGIDELVGALVSSLP